MIKLEYFENVRDHTPRPLTIEILRQLIRSPWTRTCVEKFRSTGDDQWKRKLPGITWQATYPGGVRANVGAQCTGLFMLDVDHISQCHPLPGIREALNTPLQMYRETIAPRIDELNIVCVHGTASGDGIHVIACARLMILHQSLSHGLCIHVPLVMHLIAFALAGHPRQEIVSFSFPCHRRCLR